MTGETPWRQMSIDEVLDEHTPTREELEEAWMEEHPEYWCRHNPPCPWGTSDGDV